MIAFFVNRKKENEKIYYSLAENGYSLSPKYIHSDASHTSYAHTRADSEGDITVVPEKPLGEKMLIQLRRRSKYWLYKDFFLKRFFKKYAVILKHFSINQDRQSEEFKKNMEKAELIHGKIMKYVYKKTGEDEWSLR